MGTTAVAYDPNDPTQQNFLSLLAAGESSGPNAYSEGVGGADLTGAPQDSSGFPVWTGLGNSHAAGKFQFQPQTFDPIAQQYGLNFQNPSDQNAAAWYEAQDQYSKYTGGGSLETALQSNNPSVFQSIQDALTSTWPSVQGNQALGGSLSNALTQGKSGPPLAGGGSSGPAAPGSTANLTANPGATSFLGDIENFFLRFGLFIAGGVIIFVALWQLLSNQGVVPSPAKTVKTAGEALAA